MPVFNRARVLRNSIADVLSQTYCNFELIIFNDGSTDEPSKVVRSFDDERILFIDSPVNLGPPRPLNAILSRARGELIIILHDHDRFDPSLLEKSVAHLDAYPQAGLVLQGSAWVEEDGVSGYRSMLLGLPVLNHGFSYGEKMLSSRIGFNSVFHACSMVRREALERVGMFYDDQYGLYSDTDLWLRLLRVCEFLYINEVLLTFRERERRGHFLEGKGYQVVSALLSIHETSIGRYFPSDKVKRENLIRLARRKWRLEVLRNAAHYAVGGSDELVVDGLRLVRSRARSVVERFAMMILIRSRRTRLMISWTLKMVRGR
jgi:glycosyltransferase involved in cell wall biosynthesis